MSFFGKNFAQARLEVHSLAVACSGAFGALARSVADCGLFRIIFSLC